jgi:ribosomal protein S18 acetylase RimI-like enzyme
VPLPSFHVRRAVADDADAISSVLGLVVAERRRTAIERAWTGAEQRRYLESLSAREAFHVAVGESHGVIGYQSVDLYSTVLTSMAHVAQVGTFVLPEWRGRGVGAALFEHTSRFAASAGYRKFVIQVRASNDGARAFYARLGFTECGRLSRQVVIDGQDDDEVVMEYFLNA